MTTSVLSRTGAPVITIKPAHVNHVNRASRTTLGDIVQAIKAAFLMMNAVRQTGNVSKAEFARVRAIAETL